MSPRLALLILSLCIVCGCGASQGGGVAGIEVKGSVKWRGRPLTWGYLQLLNVNDLTDSATADIVDGQFTIVPERRLKPGNYKVMIFGGMRREDNPEVSGPATPDQPRKEVLPPEYNDRSAMTVEIKASGKNDALHYDLK